MAGIICFITENIKMLPNVQLKYVIYILYLLYTLYIPMCMWLTLWHLQQYHAKEEYEFILFMSLDPEDPLERDTVAIYVFHNV